MIPVVHTAQTAGCRQISRVLAVDVGARFEVLLTGHLGHHNTHCALDDAHFRAIIRAPQGARWSRAAVRQGTTGKQVLCFAQWRDGDWEGICLDFDIAVQGRSFEEVKAALEEAVDTYVEDALREEQSVARQLLRRAAP
jgi:predicted RNase H-like HicB family nuclease